MKNPRLRQHSSGVLVGSQRLHLELRTVCGGGCSIRHVNDAVGCCGRNAAAVYPVESVESRLKTICGAVTMRADE
jgi:hypothetical protein